MAGRRFFGWVFLFYYSFVFFLFRLVSFRASLSCAAEISSLFLSLLFPFSLPFFLSFLLVVFSLLFSYILVCSVLKAASLCLGKTGYVQSTSPFPERKIGLTEVLFVYLWHRHESHRRIILDSHQFRRGLRFSPFFILFFLNTKK